MKFCIIVVVVAGWQYKAPISLGKRLNRRKSSNRGGESVPSLESLPALLFERWQTVNATLSEVTRSETYRQLIAVINEWSGNLPVNDLAKAILLNARLGSEGVSPSPVVSREEALEDYKDMLSFQTDATYLKVPVARAAQFASAAYANEDNATAFGNLGASIVTYGKALNLVPYYVIDSVNGTTLERHVIIRGFDASDTTIDRFELVSRILSAAPTPLRRSTSLRAQSKKGRTSIRSSSSAESSNKVSKKTELPFISSVVDQAYGNIDKEGEVSSYVLAHQGLLALAEAIYADIHHPQLDSLASGHRLFICGHSVGGSLSVLLAALIAMRSPDKILPKLNGVYTFAALPCLRTSEKDGKFLNPELVGLASHHVSGFIQPLDPLVRWYSEADPCYPLVDDLGSDGITLFASGPARVLRPLTRAVLQAADEWPKLRDIYRGQADQSYQSLGQQYIILPDADRYVADRLVNLFLDVPMPAALIEVPEQQDAASFLAKYFPLDEFSISLVPAAIRSFVHHFHPAYSAPLLTLRNMTASTLTALNDQQQEAQQALSQGTIPSASLTKTPTVSAADNDPILSRLLDEPLARLLIKIATGNSEIEDKASFKKNATSSVSFSSSSPLLQQQEGINQTSGSVLMLDASS